ncbi:MAG: helix-turn-helix domain-containing protein [Myxococcales bacterium]
MVRKSPPVGVAPALLTIAEVATRLGVSRATAYKLCERGDLPHHRVSGSIRVSQADFAGYLAARRRDA